MARELSALNGVAVALIAFISGLEMNAARLRPRLRSIAILGGVTAGVMYVALLPTLWLAWRWLPLAPDAAGAERLALCAVLTTLVVSFSPTVTLAVIAESRARGPYSELVLALTVLTDLALVVLFALAMQFVRWTFGGTSEEVGLLTRLSWEIFGSLAFGAAAGSAFALYLRHFAREVTLVLLALCAIISGVGARVHFEPILVALAAGLVVENVAPPAGDALRNAVERGALPVLVIFFAAAGASLDLDALAVLGVTALAVAALRLATLRLGSAVGARLARTNEPHARDAWMGLVSQAGVTLGLAIIIATEYPGWGGRLQTLIVAIIALHQLIGPVLFRRALERAGEVGRMEAWSGEPAESTS
jgi:Kef-type K+ transport system membrane component KefB